MAYKVEEAWLYEYDRNGVSKMHGKIYMSTAAHYYHHTAWFVIDGDPMHMGYLVSNKEGEAYDKDVVWFYSDEVSNDTIRMALRRYWHKQLSESLAYTETGRRCLRMLGYNVEIEYRITY
jgi:hypothetical protein